MYDILRMFTTTSAHNIFVVPVLMTVKSFFFLFGPLVHISVKACVKMFVRGSL